MKAPKMRHGVRGLSLVELLVAVVIGMVLVLVITNLIIRQDSIRRSVTGANDVAQASRHVSLTLDRALRSAGSALANNPDALYGCVLHAARSNTQILPRVTAFPAPFASVATQVRVAPMLVYGGAGADDSDVLMVMAGMAGMGEMSSNVLPGSVTASTLRLNNTVGVRAEDLVIVGEPGRPCMLQQVRTGFVGGSADLLQFGGTYAAGSIDAVNLAGYGASTQAPGVSSIGNPNGNPPRFQLIGRDADGLLWAYDLLRSDGNDTPQVIGEGVLMLRALYGIDTNTDGRIDSWVSPRDANFTAAVLGNGTAASQNRLRSILAVRVAMVVRGDLLERNAVSPETVTLFEDLPAQAIERTLSATEQRLRIGVYDFTVPLRNSMITMR